MRNYFKLYGDLVECSVLYDDQLRSRGFGFVTFAHVSSVVKVLKTAPHTVDGRVVSFDSLIVFTHDKRFAQDSGANFGFW